MDDIHALCLIIVVYGGALQLRSVEDIPPDCEVSSRISQKMFPLLKPTQTSSQSVRCYCRMRNARNMSEIHRISRVPGLGQSEYVGVFDSQLQE